MTPRRVLVLFYLTNQAIRPTIHQHLHVLDSSLNRHQILYHNVAHGLPQFLRRIDFDVVVLHTTLLCCRWASVRSIVREQLQWLRSCDSLKIAMPQDEYDHAEILDDWLADLGVSVIVSNFDEQCRPLLYPKMHQNARFLKCLTGYISESNAAVRGKQMRPIAARPRDIVYRAAHLPYWFGSHGQMKHEIASIVAERAPALGLTCDISTRAADVITGDNWYSFLESGKAIIGCESGSSVLDGRGAIQAQIRKILEGNPSLSFSEVSKLLPPGWDDYRFFALGPRHLEAVFTRTCQVLVEGDYDGVLQANRHYLPIRRDLANLDEVLHMIKDHSLLESITARAYEEIYESKKYTYGSFAKILDAEMAAVPERPARYSWNCLQWRHRSYVATHQAIGQIVSLPGRLIQSLPRDGIVRTCLRRAKWMVHSCRQGRASFRQH